MFLRFQPSNSKQWGKIRIINKEFHLIPKHSESFEKIEISLLNFRRMVRKKSYYFIRILKKLNLLPFKTTEIVEFTCCSILKIKMTKIVQLKILYL